MKYLQVFIASLPKYRELNKNLREYFCYFVMPYYSDLQRDYKKLKRFANVDFIEFLATLLDTDTQTIHTMIQTLQDFKDDKCNIPLCMHTKINL